MLRCGGLVLAAATLSAAIAGCRPPAPAPSVLLVVVDTLRADRVGALATGPGGLGQGSAGRTPGIDRWARGAVGFRRAVTPAPFTMPAMASMLTGAWPDRTGVDRHEPGTSLGPWKGTTLAEAARRAGLATSAVVANPWLVRARTGFDRGFDRFERLYRPGSPPGSNSAQAVTDAAIRELDRAGDGRFFLWVHYFDPHMPYEPPPEFAREAGAAPGPSRVMRDFDAPGRDLARLYAGEGYDAAELEGARRLYDGEVLYVDHEVARLLDHLAAKGLDRRTVVVVASDHGEALGEHGLFFAHDYTVYDELVRVALLVKAPGLAAGIRDDEASLVDVAPTLCRLASLGCDASFDGRDLLGPDRSPRTLFAATTPLRDKGTPFAGLTVPGLVGRWTMALGDGRKLVRIPAPSGASLRLYDLATDPSESHGREATSSEAGRELARSLEQWSKAMDAARPASAGAHARHRRRDEATLRSLGYLQ